MAGIAAVMSLGLSSQSLGQQFEVAAVGTEIKVKGLTPNGRAVVTGAARVPLLGAVEVEEWTEEIYDDDGDGKAYFDLGKEVPQRSIWAVVEISSGLAASTAPAESESRTTEVGPEIVEVDETTLHRIIKFERTNLIYVLVRPGVGSWRLEAWDGGTGDFYAGDPDSWLYVDPTTFSRIGDSPSSFPGLAEGDVLLAIDPSSLDLQIYRDGLALKESR